MINLTSSGSVSGHSNVGGIVGYGWGPNFSQVSSSATVTASGDYAGGIAGVTNYGSIANSSTTGKITASNYAGGLGGSYAGNIYSSAHTGGTVVAYGAYAGGLAGEYYGYATDSFATSNVSAGSYAGGIAGRLNGTINNAYASGDISAGDIVGGIAGQMNGSSVTHSYFTGSVTGNSNYGGITGYMSPSASLVNAYYNIDAVRINGATGYVSAGGLYARQYGVWQNSSTTVSSRSTGNITDYFDQDGGYYLITSATSICAAGAANCAKGDLSSLLGFSQNTNYKFKLANDLDMS
ncbi:hypothetical protein EBZ70_12655, partial [bacterium]|nr:hypothetical protein [bacterium]